MTDEELAIWKVIKEADDKFTAAAASSTKTWIRDYFLPALKAHKLKIVREEEQQK